MESSPIQQEQPKDAPPAAPKADAPATVPTIVELRAVAKDKGKTLVKALLDKYGFAGISAVPEDRRAEFMAALQGA